MGLLLRGMLAAHQNWVWYVVALLLMPACMMLANVFSGRPMMNAGRSPARHPKWGFGQHRDRTQLTRLIQVNIGNPDLPFRKARMTTSVQVSIRSLPTAIIAAISRVASPSLSGWGLFYCGAIVVSLTHQARFGTKPSPFPEMVNSAQTSETHEITKEMAPKDARKNRNPRFMRPRRNMKTSTKDKLKGSFREMKGTIKQGLGNITNDPSLKAEGKAEKRAGKVQQRIGDAKETVVKLKRKLKDLTTA